MTPHIALREAVAVAGGNRSMARSLNISHQAVRRWQHAPAERVIAIERLTGIPRQTLRPDLYPDEAVIAAKPRIPLSAEALREVTRRASARAVYSLLALNPDALGTRDATALAHRLAALLLDELTRA